MGTADLELQGIDAGDANAAPGKNLGKVEKTTGASNGIWLRLGEWRRAQRFGGPLFTAGRREARTGGDDDATRRSAGGTAPTLVAHTPSTPHAHTAMSL